MKLDGKDIKNMTKEEIDNFMKDVENNPLFRATIRGIYGSVGNLKDLINKELEDVEKEENKELSKETEEENAQNPFIIVKEKTNQNIERDNVGKKCRIINHPYIRNNTEGVVKDIVKETKQYVVVTGISDILYVNFEQVEIVDEWKDIKIKSVDEDYGEYTIVFEKDNIKVIRYDSDWLEEYEYDLNLGQDMRKKLIQILNKNEGLVAKYIIQKFKKEELSKEYKSVYERIKGLENKRNKIEADYNSCKIHLNELLKELK